MTHCRQISKIHHQVFLVHLSKLPFLVEYHHCWITLPSNGLLMGRYGSKLWTPNDLPHTWLKPPSQSHPARCCRVAASKARQWHCHRCGEPEGWRRVRWREFSNGLKQGEVCRKQFWFCMERCCLLVLVLENIKWYLVGDWNHGI